MRKQDSTLRGGWSTTQNKLIKDTDNDDLRTNPFQEEEGMTKKWNGNPIQVPIGPVTRAQAKKTKEDALHVPQGWISMIQALE
ncbi:hypothetical protein AAG906_010455 [Vitis piasezkii]